MKRISFLALGAASLIACATGPTTPAGVPATPAMQQPKPQISGAKILEHIKILASDEFEGRFPGKHGEKRTVAYLEGQFKEIGLQPGNPDGTYVQKVPLVGIDGIPKSSLKVGKKKLGFKFKQDYVAVTARFQKQVSIANSEMVFVGYGVQAPEYGWDDYKGLDVRGKTIVMLINDPAVPDASDPSRLDPKLFKGKAMTYYGRWTYKYEIASKLGAAAAVIVHETEPASYPWSVVQNSWTGEQMELAAKDKNMSRVPVQAWITLDKARELFKATGQDFDALKRAALTREFRPVPLTGARLSVAITNKVREVTSNNVIARLPGSDPKHADEHIVYAAHWDHLGRDTGLKGDQIYNGALDNASGVGGLLELGRAFRSLSIAPKRSILFLAVTAEEQGLLGSKHYGDNPLYPHEKTLAMFNMDGLSLWGPTRDVQIIGAGQNSLEDILASYAKASGREAIPDQNSEKGSYYRSDQFNFAKHGVPALYADGGQEVVGRDAAWGKQKADEYTANDYHGVSDEVKPDWNLDGAAQDMQLLLDVGLEVADGERWPEWRSDSEFRLIREQSLKR